MVDIGIIFSIIILLLSVVIHEVAHGAVAYSLGDPTAKFAGRLTLNPLKHIDLFGSIIIPLVLYLSHSPFLFGYAKPVPVNPFNFRDRKYGEAKVAAAGAAANLAIAVIFGVIMRFMPGDVSSAGVALYTMFEQIVLVNLILAVFNLVPLPPLDGSHILFSFLPPSQEEFKLFLQRYGIFFFLVFILFLSDIIFPIVAFLYKLIVGAPLL